MIATRSSKSSVKVPTVRLQRFTQNLSDRNMSRRLFYIYKYEVGRDRADRDDYVLWLKDVRMS